MIRMELHVHDWSVELESTPVTNITISQAEIRSEAERRKKRKRESVSATASTSSPQSSRVLLTMISSFHLHLPRNFRPVIRNHVQKCLRINLQLA